MEPVRGKTASGMKWTYFSTFLARGLSPVILIILARLLTPADFGLVAMAIVVTDLLRSFCDIGLNHALVQQTGDKEKIASMAFWVILPLGILWFLLIWISAPYAALYFKNDEVVPLLRTLGVMFIIQPFSDIPLSILLRDLKFKALFFRQLIPQIFSGVTAVTLAFMGFGAWALVIGTLAGISGTAIVVWFMTDWRPTLCFDKIIMKSMIRFGAYVTMQRLLGWLMLKADQMFVGRFLGASSLGIYKIGSNYGSLTLQLIGTPFHNVIYPVLCKIGKNLDEVRDKYFLYLKWISIACIPSSIALVFVVPYVIPVLLGDKWSEVIPILQLLTLQSILVSIMGVNSETYKAIGRPDINVKYFFVRVLVSIPCYYFAAKKSVIVLAAVHAGLAFLFVPINIFICSIVLGIRYFAIVREIRTGLVLGLIFTIVGLAYNPLIGASLVINPVGNTFCLSLTFLIFGISSLYLIDRKIFYTLIDLMRSTFAYKAKKAVL